MVCITPSFLERQQHYEHHKFPALIWIWKLTLILKAFMVNIYVLKVRLLLKTNCKITEIVETKEVIEWKTSWIGFSKWYINWRRTSFLYCSFTMEMFLLLRKKSYSVSKEAYFIQLVIPFVSYPFLIVISGKFLGIIINRMGF